MSRTLFTSLAALVLMLGLAEGTAMATEEPAFTVTQRGDAFEVRAYAPTIVAETLVQGPWSDAGTEGFRRLAGYIFGGNHKRSKIAMTAPVGTQDAGDRLAKGGPDTLRRQGNAWVVTFTMPAGLTLATLPQPNDPRVTLRALPARSVAVRKMPGWWSEANFEQDSAALLQAVRAAGLEPGPTSPVMARFNPPWTPFFLRRNEMWLDLAPPAAPARAD